MNAVFKYPGSKWNIAQWIINHFPAHHSYLEPFFGSGAVLFTKGRSNIETVNDLNDDIINLFEWIKNDPERLAHEVYWTPYAREVYEQAWRTSKSATDSFERAVSLYTRMMMGHGFRVTGEKVGWKNDIKGREKAYAATQWCQAPNNILAAAERLRGVQIENRPAIELIRRFNADNVLIYADPPYVLSTRHGKQYAFEMTDDEHAELLEELRHHSGPVLISGYDNSLYADLLRTWHKETICTTDQLARRREEVLWMNFEPMVQETLFENPEGVVKND